MYLERAFCGQGEDAGIGFYTGTVEEGLGLRGMADDFEVGKGIAHPFHGSGLGGEVLGTFFRSKNDHGIKEDGGAAGDGKICLEECSLAVSGTAHFGAMMATEAFSFLARCCNDMRRVESNPSVTSTPILRP
jgi:hypothetical protein